MVGLTILFAIILFIFIFSSIRKGRFWEKGIIERLGKYKKPVDSGLNPVREKMKGRKLRVCEAEENLNNKLITPELFPKLQME